MSPTGRDVAAVIRAQHEEIERLIGAVKSGGTGDEVALAFFRFRVLLAAHERAEELAIHPRTAEFDSAAGADRLAEERTAVDLIWKLEKTMPGSSEFAEQFIELASNVVDHATAEQELEFPVLAQIRAGEQAQVMLDVMNAVDDFATSADAPDPGASFEKMMRSAQSHLRTVVKSGR
jgi:hemerythrin superfamily protein